MSKWYSFYKDRVNSTYQAYFETRYRPFLEYIAKEQVHKITEAGCGIASVSKYLTRYDVQCNGFDLSKRMVSLAHMNVPTRGFWQDDILKRKQNIRHDGLVVTHGVLEHFSDKQIHKILDLNPYSVHYVPLDLYDEPSFGDERLLPVKYWVNEFGLKNYATFNNGHDLMFKV